MSAFTAVFAGSSIRATSISTPWLLSQATSMSKAHQPSLLPFARPDILVTPQLVYQLVSHLSKFTPPPEITTFSISDRIYAFQDCSFFGFRRPVKTLSFAIETLLNLDWKEYTHNLIPSSFMSWYVRSLAKEYL